MKHVTASTFEFLLLEKSPGAWDAAAALDAILAGGLVQPLGSDPCHAIYRNPDTGVVFSLALAVRLADLWQARREGAEGEPGEEELEERGAAEDGGRGEGVEDAEEEGEEEGEEPFEIQETPVGLSLPLLAPNFFLLEALALAGRVAAAAGLHLERPEPREGTAAGWDADAQAHLSHTRATAEGILADWDRSRRSAVRVALEKGECTVAFSAGAGCSKVQGTEAEFTRWSAEKAEAWWRYGAARQALRAELGPQGVQVPLLQPAIHGGRIVSLCDWLAGAPVALPRTDLVLLRRERFRKGLIFTRKVMEEGIVEGQVIWDILAPHAEHRREPVEMLLYRPGLTPPQEVTAQLEVLPIGPLDSARRTGLVGVLDFDPSA
jgi:hypothetical protein